MEGEKGEVPNAQEEVKNTSQEKSGESAADFAAIDALMGELAHQHNAQQDVLQNLEGEVKSLQKSSIDATTGERKYLITNGEVVSRLGRLDKVTTQLQEQFAQLKTQTESLTELVEKLNLNQ